MTRRSASSLALLALPLLAASSGDPLDRRVPYWASITAGEARMRTGPGKEFPAIWLYRRAGLPVKVVQVAAQWRKIDGKMVKSASGWRRVQDQDGATGWMLANLLSDRRTAVVVGGTHALRRSPSAGAPVAWMAEQGVVGLISGCGGGWCAFETKGRKGFVEVAHLWGVGPTETVE